MIVYTNQDRDLDLGADTGTIIVIPTNLTQRIGLGLVRQAERWTPGFIERHRAGIRNGSISPTRSIPVSRLPTGALLYSLPVKHDPYEDASLALISTQLIGLANFLNRQPLAYHEVRIPRIGCGLGHLDWEDVHAVIMRHASALEGKPQRVTGRRVVIYGKRP